MATSIVKEAADAARELLASTWRVLDDGLVAVPVDPFRICAALGIDVFSEPMSDDRGGRIVKHPGWDPAIYINAKDSTNRARFTCAHELGHYVRRGGEDAFEYTDNRDQLSGKGTEPDERYANAFAAELLMPEASVRAAHASGLPVAVLAARFGVSGEAMGYRLSNLRIG